VADWRVCVMMVLYDACIHSMRRAPCSNTRSWTPSCGRILDWACQHRTASAWAQCHTGSLDITRQREEESNVDVINVNRYTPYVMLEHTTAIHERSP